VRRAVLLLALIGCARRLCGRLDHEQIEEFHRSHALSKTANDSSVAVLASENWLVCVEGGRAVIQNHCAQVDELMTETIFDGGCE
jgi:hypothetical protein